MVKLTMTSVMRQIEFCGYGKFDLRAFIFKGVFFLSLEVKENTDICNKHKNVHVGIS